MVPPRSLRSPPPRGRGRPWGSPAPGRCSMLTALAALKPPGSELVGEAGRVDDRPEIDRRLQHRRAGGDDLALDAYRGDAREQADVFRDRVADAGLPGDARRVAHFHLRRQARLHVAEVGVVDADAEVRPEGRAWVEEVVGDEGGRRDVLCREHVVTEKGDRARGLGFDARWNAEDEFGADV